MPEKKDQPAEFTSDEQRDAYIEALKNELAYLEAQAASEDREDVAKKKRGRADQVKGHIERLTGKTAQKRPRGAEAETR